MKNLFLYMLIFTAALFGCKKDKSNYDYKALEKITITGISNNYTVISEKEGLNITPEVTSTDPDAQFEYLWGIYETNAQGYIPVLDTIAKTKNLNYLIKQPAKAWVVVFRVTNKHTKYTQYFNSTINVVTEFTRGWYVAKDDGTQSDLDLFLTPINIVPNSKREDIYSFVNGAKMPGKANLLSFITAYKSTVTGSLANTRTLVMSTDKDMATVNVNTLKNIYTSNDIFFEPPAAKGPYLMFPGASAYYVINGGTLHTIVTSSLNVGKFGGRFLRDANNSPYNISKYYMTNSSSNGYFFDETSSSFVGVASGFGTSVSSLTDVAGTSMSATNTNQKVLYMGLKSFTYLPAPAYRYTFTGCVLFQDKTNPSIKTLAHADLDQLTIKLTNSPVLATEKLYNSSNHTLLYGEENIMYFSVNNNEVWSRNLSNNFEKLEYAAPADEEITFIRHKASTAANYAYNFIMVGTKVGSNYKIRMFNKASGSINGEPAFTLEGTGIARDVLYISPSIAESSYSIQW